MTIPNITPYDEIAHEIGELYEQIAGVTAIENEAQHEAVTALFEALHDAGKRAEALRVEEAKPHQEAEKEVQSKFHPLIGNTKAGKGKVVRGKEVLQDLLAPYRKRIADEKAALARKAEQEAEAERLAAIEAMRASSGDIEAREQAEQQLVSAEMAEKVAKRANKESTTGLGLRTVWTAKIVDQRAAVLSAMKREPEKFIELALEIGKRAATSGVREMSGYEIYSERVAR